MPPRTTIGSLIELGNHRVHVREDGPADAPTVLLLHGFAGSMHWYDRPAANLCADHHVVRLDLIGHGGTTGPLTLNADEQASTARAVLDDLDAERVTAVGHSFGADIAVALGLISARVTRVMIVGQAPDLTQARLPRGGAIMAAPVLGSVLHRSSPPFALRRGARWGFRRGFDQHTGFDDPHQIIADLRAMHPRMYRVILRERVRRLAADPLDAQSRRSPAKTAVVLGRHDQFYDCEATAGRYRGAGLPVEVIEDAGHSPNVERPDAVADLIRAFATSS